MPAVDIDKFKKLMDKVKKANKSKTVTFGSAGELTLIPSYIPYGIPSGLPQMDWAIGRNGYPAGRIIELWGFEMSGKSAAAMAALAGIQSIGGTGCWIEAEHTFDPERLTTAGVDLERTMIAEVDTLEDIFRVQDEIITNRAEIGDDSPFLFIVDSIGSVTSTMDHERFDGEGGKKWNTSQVGVDAKQTKGLLRILNSRLAKAQTTTIFVNHGTETASTMPGAKTSKAGGGHAIKFYASVRAEFKKFKSIKDDEVANRRAGQMIEINIEKLKGTSINRSKFVSVLIDGLFDPYEGLYEAMIDSELMSRPQGAQMVTFDPGEGEHLVRTFKRREFKEFVDEFGGYGKMYRAWLDWCLAKGKMRLWGK